MKASNSFEAAIKTFIEAESNNDQDLATAVLSQDKNLQDCCSYIMGEVKKLKVSAMTNDEVFGLAKTYYLTKDLKKPAKVNGTVVVGGTPEQVQEYIKSDKQKVVAAEKPKAPEPKPKKAKKEEKPADGTQLSLFDLMQ